MSATARVCVSSSKSRRNCRRSVNKRRENKRWVHKRCPHLNIRQFSIGAFKEFPDGFVGLGAAHKSAALFGKNETDEPNRTSAACEQSWIMVGLVRRAGPVIVCSILPRDARRASVFLRRRGWLLRALLWSRCRTRCRARARCRPVCADKAIAPGARADRDCCLRRCTV